MSDPYGSRLYRRNRVLVIAQAAGRCQVRLPGCKGIALTADHIVPLSRGGSHDLGNLRACCTSCNYRMGAALANGIKQRKELGRPSRRW